MLKQSYTTNNHHHLYDKVRQDLFEENHHSKSIGRTPSITTILLLQLQASTIQLLSLLPQQQLSPWKQLDFISRQKQLFIGFFTAILRWIMLFFLLLLDNVARILNVEREMNDITMDHEEEQVLEEDYNHNHNHYHHHQHSMSEYCLSLNTTTSIASPPPPPPPSEDNNNSPTSRRFGNLNSPGNSPTPNFVVRQRKTSNNAIATTTEFSPVLSPSRVKPGRLRSLSNNMLDNKKFYINNATQQQQQKQLRRINGQREMNIQNVVLPIPTRQKTSRKPPLIINASSNNSVTSRRSSNSSESSVTKETMVIPLEYQQRPRMQKTMSLSTAQNEMSLFNKEKALLRKQPQPFERCCPACATSSSHH